MRAFPAAKSRRRGRPGFTLIETMIVLAILLVLLAAGLPDFRRLIQAQRLSVTVNEFFAAVMLARSEAIRRGAQVALVPAAAADWTAGWVVLVDGNGNQRPDPGEDIILVHGPAPAGMAIRLSISDSRHYLIYNAFGRSTNYRDTHFTRSGNWMFTLDGGRRKLIVNFLGRPRTCNPDAAKANCK